MLSNVDSKKTLSVLLDSSKAGFAHYYKCAVYSAHLWYRLYREERL